MTEKGLFRRDLYYRLTAFPIQIPLLKERKDDIPSLANAFLSAPSHMQQTSLSTEAIEKLLSYDYPGNVRELRNILERAAILAAGSQIHAHHIQFEPVSEQSNVLLNTSPAESTNSFSTRSRVSGQEIKRALERFNGNRSKAAHFLGISERSVYRYLHKEKSQQAIK